MLITGLLVLVASGLVMAIAAAPTMALWVLALATWLLNLGADLACTPASDTVYVRNQCLNAPRVHPPAPNLADMGWVASRTHLAEAITSGVVGQVGNSRIGKCRRFGRPW